MEVPWGLIFLKIFIVGLVLGTRIVVVWMSLCNLKLDCTRLNNNCKCGGRLCPTSYEVEHTQKGSNDFGMNLVEIFLRILWRAKEVLDCHGLQKFGWKSQPFQSGRRKPSSPSYGSGQKTWLNPGVYWTKMANGQQKWIQWNRVSWWRKCLLCNAIRLGQMADLGNEPLTSDDEEACFEDVWIP